MQLNPGQIRALASMLCDYATVENCLEPHELDIIIAIAVEANFPQDTIERVWRVHAQALADLEA